MRSLVLYVFVGLVFFSCGLDDYYYEKDIAPVFGWFGNENGDSLLLTDNVKIGQQLVYMYHLKDNEIESPTVYLEDKEGDYDFEITESQFFININKEGVCRGTLVASDMYNKCSRIKFDLTSFANMSPIAKCSVAKLNNLSEREVLIDLSDSYDQDAQYGGFIESYDYTITNSGGNVFHVTNGLSKMGYIFEDAGLQKIDFKVCDNNGSWSETGTVYVEF